MTLDLSAIRNQFPALHRHTETATPPVFFDNPGGTQISQPSLARMNAYLLEHNANHGGAFPTSQQSDAILEEAHLAMADFYNAARPEEIVFGNNMTTLTLHISRSLARTWQPGDSIVVTRLDHDANVTPWVLAAQDRGCQVHWVNFHLEDGTLNLEDMHKALAHKPRLFAVGYASNSLGTINPLEELIPLAHATGTLVYVDAVQHAPHAPIDVQQLGCDFLVSSAYKYFGPHAGVLYGRYDLLDELFAYKVRPATNSLPGKFETGTQNHEGVAGVLGAVEYFDWLGSTFGQAYTSLANRYSGRRLRLKQALAAINAHELEISRALLTALSAIPGVKVYGITAPQRLEERVPTFSFTLQGKHPRQAAQEFAAAGVYVWDGNYYALNVTECLGLEESGGMLRVGPVHYNTLEEVQRFADVLARIAR